MGVGPGPTTSRGQGRGAADPREPGVRVPCPARLLGGEGPGAQEVVAGVFWVELSSLLSSHNANTAGQSTAARELAGLLLNEQEEASGMFGSCSLGPGALGRLRERSFQGSAGRTLARSLTHARWGVGGHRSRVEAAGVDSLRLGYF